MEFLFAEIAAGSINISICDGQWLHHARRPSHAAAEFHGAGNFPQASRRLHAMVR